MGWNKNIQAAYFVCLCISPIWKARTDIFDPGPGGNDIVCPMYLISTKEGGKLSVCKWNLMYLWVRTEDHLASSTYVWVHVWWVGAIKVSVISNDLIKHSQEILLHSCKTDSIKQVIFYYIKKHSFVINILATQHNIGNLKRYHL